MSNVNVGRKRYILLFLCTVLSIQAADSPNSWYSNWYNGLINFFSPSTIKKEHVAASALALGAAASMCYLYNRYSSEPISQRILRIINSIDPNLYAAIIKVDPTGKEHIKLGKEHAELGSLRFVASTLSTKSGLPLMFFGNAIPELSDDILRAIVAHELGHYVSGHFIIGERKIIHPPLFETDADISQEFAKGKKVSGQLPAKKSFQLAYERTTEYEADRSEILDFGIDVAIAIEAAKIMQNQEQKEQALFTRSHPLWSNRIDHFKALGQEVELRKARHEPRQQINWEEHAKAYLELIEEYKKSLKKK